jgi:hypothetical protein
MSTSDAASAADGLMVGNWEMSSRRLRMWGIERLKSCQAKEAKKDEETNWSCLDCFSCMALQVNAKPS